MSTPSQAMLNHTLFNDQYISSSSQIDSFSFPSLMPFGCNQSTIKTLSAAAMDAPLHNFSSSEHANLFLKQKDEILSNFGGPQILSLQRSTTSANFCYRTWGDQENDCINMKRNGGDDHQDHNHLGVSTLKMKKINKARRKVREPRFCFKTMSDVDVLDDGYKWRKYGQKVVKNTQHPRSYYRCTQDNCRVKKRVERLAEDPRMVITTYEGRHVHSPSHEDDDLQASSQLDTLFW